MVVILMASLGFPKIKVFWNKGYDITTYVHQIIDQILLHDLICIVNVVMRPKFGNSSIYMREVITSTSQGFDHKNHFFWGMVLVEIQ